MVKPTIEIASNTQQPITASIEEIGALMQLIMRAPMSTAERLFTEHLFERWRAQIEIENAPPTPPD